LVRVETREIKLRDFVLNARRRPSGFLMLGILVELFGLLVLAGGTFVVPFIPPAYSFFISLATLFGFLKLRRIGKSLRVNPRQQLLKDPRMPILYLRPFFHSVPEDMKIATVFANLFSKPPITLQRQEAVTESDADLANALRTIGPVVAVGVPREKLSPPGAIRLYFEPDEWQQGVTDLMSISRLLIIQAGSTGGLEWEMKTAMMMLPIERIVFSFADWISLEKTERERKYKFFKQRVEQMFQITLPNMLGDGVFLYFDKRRQPHVTRPGLWIKIFVFVPLGIRRRSWPPVIRECLRPIVKHSGLYLDRWRTVASVVVTNVMVLGLLCWLAVPFYISLLVKTDLWNAHWFWELFPRWS
jgi:hypothetical protein